MENGIIGLLFAWFLAILFHFLSVFMKKKYLKMEIKYKNDIALNGDNNFKKNSLDLFGLYIKVLIICKWFLFIYGILSLIRGCLAKYFD